MRRYARVVMLAAGMSLAAGTFVGTAGQSTAPDMPSVIRAGTVAATPVSGPGSLRRLGLQLQHSAMGWTGRLGPAADAAPPAWPRATPSVLPELSLLTGADLYRLNCRACHRADGRGAPAEILSVIDPIRATSPLMVRERMAAMGRPITAAFAGELAVGAREDVLKRLKNGGESMPAFDHLSRAEIDALFAYLEWLAGVPGADRRQLRVAEPASRIGEHLVKGTCHICHDATGPWPGPEALLDGVMPSLSSVVGQRTIDDVLAKVRRGKPVILGVARIAYRGRMPVFDYVSDGEVSAAYRYLVAYPPQPAPARTAPRGGLVVAAGTR